MKSSYCCFDLDVMFNISIKSLTTTQVNKKDTQRIGTAGVEVYLYLLTLLMHSGDLWIKL